MITLERSLLDGLTHHAPQPAMVRAALQRALALEHSTIPLYLYALYSLVPGENSAVQQVLSSVVVEEMLHMVLAANVLNALGGAPELSRPHFIPTYPGRLPGGVEQHLTVHLRRFSLDQLETFIEIEEPRETRDHVALPTEATDEPCTIGEFYTSIIHALTRLDPECFCTPARHQVGPDLLDGAVVVTDAATAVAALEVIIEQGEGTATSPQEVAGYGGVNDFAHFYRLREIQQGRRLVPAADARGGYDYAGEAIVFTPSGVYPVPDDPRMSDYSKDSPAYAALGDVNRTYSELLRILERFVNGHHDHRTFDAALATMHTLERQARALASGHAVAGVHLGPTFEFLEH